MFNFQTTRPLILIIKLHNMTSTVHMDHIDMTAGVTDPHSLYYNPEDFIKT